MDVARAYTQVGAEAFLGFKPVWGPEITRLWAFETVVLVSLLVSLLFVALSISIGYPSWVSARSLRLGLYPTFPYFYPFHHAFICFLCIFCACGRFVGVSTTTPEVFLERCGGLG